MGIDAASKSILNNYIARLTQGVVVIGNSVNPGFVLRNVRDQIIRIPVISFRKFDEYRGQFICASMGRPGIVVPPTTAVGVPIIENIPDRDIVNGFDPFRLMMNSPVDAFGPGDGSYGYIMYYNLVNGFSTITTSAYATVPENVYSGNGVEDFLNFL